MAALPYLYALALLGIAYVLLYPRPRLTLATYYLAVFMLFHGPAFFTYHLSVESQSSQDVMNQLAGVLLISLCGFTFGRWFADPSGQANDAVTRWQAQPIQDVAVSPTILKVAVAAVCVIALVNLLLLGAGTRLVHGFSLDESDLVVGEYRRLRTDQAEIEAVGIPAVAFTYLCRHGIGRFLALFLLIQARRQCTVSRVAMALGFGGLILASQLSMLTKSDAVFFLGQATLAWLMAGPGPVRLQRYAIPAFLILMAALIAIYRKFTVATDTVEAILLIWHRVTEIPNLCLARYFENFPNIYDHTWGLNIRLLHGFFAWGETYVPAHSLIDEHGGKSNAMYVADAWVDFSWAGVIVSSILVGWTLGCLDRVVFRKRDTVSVALFTALLAPVHSLMSMSLVTCFGGFGLLALPLFTRFLRLDAHSGTTGDLIAPVAAPRPVRRPTVDFLPA